MTDERLGELEALATRIVARRPYIDDEPLGYLESDRDFLDNNNAVAVAVLESGVLPELIAEVRANHAILERLAGADVDAQDAEAEVRAKDAEIERLRATLGDVHQSLGGIIDSESPGGWRLGSPYASQPGGNVLIHTPDGHLTTLHKSLLATWLTRLTEALR